MTDVLFRCGRCTRDLAPLPENACALCTGWARARTAEAQVEALLKENERLIRERDELRVRLECPQSNYEPAGHRCSRCDSEV